MKYYVTRDGITHGPLALEELKSKVASGALSPRDMAWNESTFGWTQVGQLVGAAASPPAEAQKQPPARITSRPGSAGVRLSPPVPRTQPDSPPPARDSGPNPPSLHWAIVWLFSVITGGLYAVIWTFRQFWFMKRIDPRNVSAMLYTQACIAWLLGMYICAYGRDVVGAGLLLVFFSVLLYFMALFRARASLHNFYGKQDPMHLYLSAGMTFFFQMLYFQFHLSRIAKWKRTGTWE